MYSKSGCKKTLVVVFAVALLLSVSALGYAQGKGNSNPGVLPPHSKAFGKTLSEWAGIFTQTSWTMPASEAQDGFQLGHIYFLANWYGNESSVTLAPGTPLFIPVVFWATLPPYLEDLDYWGWFLDYFGLLLEVNYQDSSIFPCLKSRG